ncbi:hypothetical protein MKY85_25520 [Paenibacillus sp. FSL R5-0749]|uniref:hypothetical protein n=1 Tax=Paenibacillus sp. FSL R5-0749 TaxID=2921657 RepID=UPI00315B2649
MKKAIILLLTLVLTILPVLSVSAESNAQELDSQAIAERFDEINSKYELNEKFSEEDAEFVKKYAIPAQPSQSSQSEVSINSFWDGNTKFTLAGYGKVGQNSYVKTVGFIEVQLGLVSGNMNFSMTSNDVNKIYHSTFTNEVKIAAYGVVGSDGIGLTLDRTYTNTLNNANYNKYLDTDSYLANMAYYQVSASVKVKDTGLTTFVPITMTKE